MHDFAHICSWCRNTLIVFQGFLVQPKDRSTAQRVNLLFSFNTKQKLKLYLRKGPMAVTDFSRTCQMLKFFKCPMVKSSISTINSKKRNPSLQFYIPLKSSMRTLSILKETLIIEVQIYFFLHYIKATQIQPYNIF